MGLSNANILVDSSIWVDFFKGNERVAFVSDLLLEGLVCTNEVILTELFPSMRIRREENLILRICMMRINCNASNQLAHKIAPKL